MNEVIEVERGNKTIAIFDGWTKTNDTVLGGAFWYKKDRTTRLLYQMQYHSSWNALMPVVEKIESDCKYEVEITSRHMAIRKNIISHNEERLILSMCGKTKIEAVWLAVVEFINFYNQNKDK